MYLAKTNILQTQAPFYINILEDIIAGAHNEERGNIDSAINEAIEIANNRKDIYTINNNHYFLVTTLLSAYKNKLVILHQDEFNESIYKEILSILK